MASSVLERKLREKFPESTVSIRTDEVIEGFRGRPAQATASSNVGGRPDTAVAFHRTDPMPADDDKSLHYPKGESAMTYLIKPGQIAFTTKQLMRQRDGTQSHDLVLVQRTAINGLTERQVKSAIITGGVEANGWVPDQPDSDYRNSEMTTRSSGPVTGINYNPTHSFEYGALVGYAPMSVQVSTTSQKNAPLILRPPVVDISGGPIDQFQMMPVEVSPVDFDLRYADLLAKAPWCLHFMSENPFADTPYKFGTNGAQENIEQGRFKEVSSIKGRAADCLDCFLLDVPTARKLVGKHLLSIQDSDGDRGVLGLSALETTHGFGALINLRYLEAQYAIASMLVSSEHSGKIFGVRDDRTGAAAGLITQLCELVAQAAQTCSLPDWNRLVSDFIEYSKFWNLDVAKWAHPKDDIRNGLLVALLGRGRSLFASNVRDALFVDLWADITHMQKACVRGICQNHAPPGQRMVVSMF